MKTATRMSITAGFAVSLLIGLASAQEESDRSVLTLYRACQADPDNPASFCRGYLIGVADTLSTFGSGGHKAGLCAPRYNGATLERLFLDWVPEHRDLWEVDMFVSVQAAFREQWPCY